MTVVAPRSERIRLMIVDDHLIIRHGLRSVFASHRDIEIVGEASDAAAAATLCHNTRSDVALVDLRLQSSSGLEVLHLLRERSPSCRPVMLTGYATEHDVREAMAAGARGYVLKHADPAEIVSAVRAVHAGRRYLSPQAAMMLADSMHASPLTDREQQVLQLMVPGHRNRTIARTLGIAEETVKAHVKKILIKLGVRDRTEAATRAIQRGLVRVD